MVVGIQGIEGSFHHIAANKVLKENFEILPALTFSGLIQKTCNNETDISFFAIENSIVGSILPNYSLLQSSNLHIIGEVYLKINQHLIVNKNVSIHDIKEIHSHPMAIMQCYAFIEKHTWKIVETEDTALSAKQLKANKLKTISAIGSKLAAQLFDLHILEKNIHTLKNNYTRFLIISNNPENKKWINNQQDAKKASIYFEVEDKKGSLSQVLNRFSYRDINLLKIQSSPVPGSHWKYYFHADLEFNQWEDFKKSMEEIRPVTYSSRVYGVYPKGKLYIS